MSSNITADTIRAVFVSLGCNREPGVMDWSHSNGLVAYGGSSLVAIYNPTESVNAVVGTLRGHSNDINCVVWLDGVDGVQNVPEGMAPIGQVSSGGFDGKIIVWDLFQANSTGYSVEALNVSAITDRYLDYRVSAILTPPSSSGADTVTNIANINTPAGTFLAGCTASGRVHVWFRGNSPAASAPDEWTLVQTFEYNTSQIMQSVAFATYSFSDGDAAVLLALAGVDTKVHVMTCSLPSHTHSGDKICFAPSFFMLGTLDGHIDWVRSISFCALDDDADTYVRAGHASTMLLASASQDKTVRLWRFCAPNQDTLNFLDRHTDTHVHDDTIAAGEGACAEGITAEAVQMIASSTLGERGHLFSCGAGTAKLVSVTLESVLVGHEEWVLSAKWHPRVRDAATGRSTQPLSLLTASADKTMMLWGPDAVYGSALWVNTVRVGEAGGNTLGFFGACFSSDGSRILGVGYSGCFHLWQRRGAEEWECAPTVSGHNREVVDVAVCTGDSEYQRWTGKIPTVQSLPYIITASMDQTARVFAPFARARVPLNRRVSADALPALAQMPWFETARPQVHGWDLTAVAPVPGQQHEYVCASEEKLMRVMKAPVPFLGSLYCLGEETPLIREQLVAMFEDNAKRSASNSSDESKSGQTHDSANEAGGDLSDLSDLMGFGMGSGLGADGDYSLMNLRNTEGRALSANLPELGLSNKAVMEGDAVMAENAKFPNKDIDLMFVPAELHTGLQQVFVQQPPVEDELVSCTLWPEVEKLYGHGYDLASITSARATTLLASAAHARKLKSAAIRLWDTRTWQEVAQLVAHGSTVTQMAFSPGNQLRYSAAVQAYVVKHGLDDRGFCARSAVAEDASVDKYLVSVSRDQQYAVFRRNMPDSEFTHMVKDGRVTVDTPVPHYVLTDVKKCHSRQIYAMAWCEDGASFLTSSRDKTLKYWTIDTQNKAECKQTLTLPYAATALACTHAVHNNMLIQVLLVGTENGLMQLYTRTCCSMDELSEAAVMDSTAVWEHGCDVHTSLCHSDAITRMMFVPRVADEAVVAVSVAKDHSVRMFTLEL